VPAFSRSPVLLILFPIPFILSLAEAALGTVAWVPENAVRQAGGGHSKKRGGWR
jgi:hypothetical protein